MPESLQSLKAFVGYQLKSDFHSEEHVKSLMLALEDRLRASGIALNVTYGRFPAGVILWDSVRDAIRSADIAIFDISENSPNVMIEVGLALGYSKRVLLLKNSSSSASHPKPSDLSYIYISYDGDGVLNSPGIIAELERAVLAYVQSPREPDHYFKGVWSLGEFDDVVVACSELDDPEKLQHPEPWEFIYLSKYGDLDALFEVESTIHELYPNVHVEHKTGSEVLNVRGQDQLSGNLVLVGGPDYNSLTQVFEKFSPVEYLPANEENNIAVRIKNTGETLMPHREPETSLGSERVVDFGFFVNRRNPYNPDKRLVMLGGSHTYGVYGAIKAFSYSRRGKDLVAHRNCRDIVDRFGPGAEFFALFDVHGAGSSVPTPKLDPSRVWRLP